MTDWDTSWAGRYQHYARPESEENDDDFGPRPMGGGSEEADLLRRVTAVHARRSLELSKTELPRGGVSLAAQVGAELRAVYAQPITTELAGLEDLLAQIDRWHEDLN